MSFDPHKAFEKIASGNNEAQAFCAVAYEYFHLIDDLFDGQKRTPDEVATITFFFADVIANNSFFQEHRGQLLPLMRSGAMAWAGSEDLRLKDSLQDKVAAEVLKSWYQELFYSVAAITGGMTHALACAREFRGYDFS